MMNEAAKKPAIIAGVYIYYIIVWGTVPSIVPTHCLIAHHLILSISP